METRRVYDDDGVWLVNTAQFAFVDPTTGYRFDPRVPTQAKHTEWLQGQEVIQKYRSPKEEAAEAEAAAKAEAAAAAKAAADAEAAAKAEADAAAKAAADAAAKKA